MSGGLAPSKSTCYVGNLPFSLTNNDVYKVFSKFGNVVKITILRDKITRESKGVAFIQYLERDSALNACKSVDQKTLFERKIKCVIAKDNGRASEFIKKKEYPDKSSCYECGELGHLSYNCPKNILGDREPPPKKEKKRKKEREFEKERSRQLIADYYNEDEKVDGDDNDEEEEQGENLYESSLSFAIQQDANEQYKSSEPYQSSERDNSQPSSSSMHNNDNQGETFSQPRRKKYKQSSYFSDEEEEEVE